MTVHCMRWFVVAPLALGLTAGAAQAQGVGGPGGMGGGGRHHQAKAPDKADTGKTKADDKAYSAALRSLPDKKYDPWGKMR
jgi:hypothetical protein